MEKRDCAFILNSARFYCTCISVIFILYTIYKLSYKRSLVRLTHRCDGISFKQKTEKVSKRMEDERTCARSYHYFKEWSHGFEQPVVIHTCIPMYVCIPRRKYGGQNDISSSQHTLFRFQFLFTTFFDHVQNCTSTFTDLRVTGKVTLCRLVRTGIIREWYVITFNALFC